MGWQASLRLDYALENGRSVARFCHQGPLRILQTLWPEGPGICHNVLVHPPGGLVAGDRLEIQVEGGPGSHALVTTPGASRFYRSEGPQAVQDVRLRLAAGARLEWLPLEALYYSGCNAANHLQCELAPGAELLAWDIAAFGLPEAGHPFVAGRVLQHVELVDGWLERGLLDAGDRRLLDGPLGLAGRRCLASLFLASGSPLADARREQLLEAARAVLQDHPLAATAGVTSPEPRVVVLRVLAPLVEPALHLLKAVRRVWRPLAWDLEPVEPRGWVL